MLNQLLVLAFVLDPAVVLAVWFLACLAALAVGLLVAWLVQRRPADPFAGPDRPHLVTAMWTETGRRVRHGIFARATWKPMHTAAAVKRRGQHHSGDGGVPVAYLLEHTQDITAETVAAVNDLHGRAA